MYYNIELINEKTKETILYEDVQDLNDGEKMYFNFQINAQELKDGEYKLNVIDGNGDVVASDTLNVGEFDIVGIQHKRGENVYINTVLDAKTEANDVEIREINSIVFPSGDADAMTSVFVRARPVFNDGYTEGYDNGHTDGYNSGKTDGFEEGKTEGYNEGKTDGIAEGIEEQKNKLTPIEITENGTYSNENGYNEVTVNVQDTNGSYADGYNDGIEEQKSKLTDITITENGSYSNDNGYKDIVVNVADTNGSYDEGYNEGIANAETTIAENAQVLDITANGKYTTKYSGGEGNLIKEVNVSVPKGGGGCVDFEQIGYDENDVTSFNDDIAYSKTLYDAWNPSNTSASRLFQNNTNLVYCPKIDTSNVTDMGRMFNTCKSLVSIPLLITSNATSMYYMFSGCSSLKSIPLLDTSNVTDMYDMFNNCSTLTSIPLLDTSKVMNMSQMFGGCSSLVTIPQLDTSNVTSMNFMFYSCTKLTTIPSLDTSNVTDMGYMFYVCSTLNSIPLLDTSNVTDMSYMFGSCKSLTTIPLLDTSKVEDMGNMFDGCSSLESIPQLDTSNVVNMGTMFSGCSSLVSIPLLDTSKVTSMQSVFGYSSINTLTDLGGFKDLKIDWNDNYGLYRLPNLTHQSIMNVINNLYDFRGNGDATTTRTLKMNSNTMALLSNDDKAIAVNKGWTLTS